MTEATPRLSKWIMLCESANGLLLPATGDPAVITVTNRVIPRNGSWCVRAWSITTKPTVESEAAMVRRGWSQGISSSSEEQIHPEETNWGLVFFFMPRPSAAWPSSGGQLWENKEDTCSETSMFIFTFLHGLNRINTQIMNFNLKHTLITEAHH